MVLNESTNQRINNMIHNGIDNLPNIRNAVIAVGAFDGVHLGHRQILTYLKEAAQRLGGESVVITFQPHPQQVLHPERDFFLINTPEDNIKLIEKEGINHIIIFQFTPQFAQTPFHQFLELLIKKIGMKAIVMGPNHNFGRNGEGNSLSMREICEKNSIENIQIPEFIMEENKVRSSKIREHIINKEFTKAEHLLGHPYKKK